MNPSTRQRLAQIIALVDKEDRHLAGVRKRLLGNDCAIGPARLNELLADDLGIDRLESFAAKFGRMQGRAKRSVPTRTTTAARITRSRRRRPAAGCSAP